MRSIAILFVALVYLSIAVSALPIEKRGGGSATFYTPGLGSCGETSSESDMVAALSSSSMKGSKSCGQKLQVTHQGKSVTVTAVDTCPSCGSGDVDLSPAAFKKLASLSEGRIPVTWSFS